MSFFGNIFKSVGDAVSGATKVVGDAISGAGDAVGDAISAAGQVAGDLVCDVTDTVGDVISGAGKITSEVANSAANAAAAAANGIDELLSGTAENIANVVGKIPVIGGIAKAAATVVDGVTDGAEIVVQHFTMKVSQAGRAIETTTDVADGVLTAAGKGDLGEVLDVVKDGVGELLVEGQQYIAVHLDHDLKLLKIPGKILSEGASEILNGVVGDNVISDAPYILDNIQEALLGEGLYDGVIDPALDIAADINSSVFGDDYDILTAEDMGMGPAPHLDNHGMGDEFAFC